MAPVLARAVLKFQIWINTSDFNAGQCNFRPPWNSWRSLSEKDNSYSKQWHMRLHSSTNTQGKKLHKKKKQNKFGLPIYIYPLTHQHLNENMNAQSKGICGWECRWCVRGKMATIAWDRHCRSRKEEMREPGENRVFHKIISSFQAVSPHLTWHTFFSNVFHYPSSTFNGIMFLGRGLICI